MWGHMLVSICFVAVSVVSSENKSKLVHTAQGPVKGYKDPYEDIFVFYNIPYAKAPTGGEKFKAPLPVSAWSTPLEAIDQKIICPQIQSNFVNPSEHKMQEDCLVASIYVPNTEEKNLPVLVNIHGGGFILGYGDMLTPKKLVSSKKIVAVTFNYRLGAHGFLCLGTKDIPGNGGLKDQVALLHWVQQNIKEFGGSPDDVTISGFSAGSSSVDLLMISKMSQNLFHKAIPESGDALSPYSIQVRPVQSAKEYAQLINFDNGDDFDALVHFYKNISHEILYSGDIGNRPDSTFLFAPCVERDIGEERFLDESPIDLLRRGEFNKIPILSGFNNMEGLMRIGSFDQWKVEMNANFSRFLPADLYFEYTEERDEVIYQIKLFYFNNQPVDNSKVLNYVDYISDVIFTCPTLRATRLLLENGNENIYFYEHIYVDESTPKIPYTDVRGAGHCAQTLIVLDESSNGKDAVSETSQEWRTLMRETWLNFITKGKPENSALPEWKPLRINSFKYMELSQNSKIKKNLLHHRCSFWNNIYNKYYQMPISPEH